MRQLWISRALTRNTRLSKTNSPSACVCVSVCVCKICGVCTEHYVRELKRAPFDGNIVIHDVRRSLRLGKIYWLPPWSHAHTWWEIGKSRYILTLLPMLASAILFIKLIRFKHLWLHNNIPDYITTPNKLLQIVLSISLTGKWESVGLNIKFTPWNALLAIWSGAGLLTGLKAVQ